MRDSSAFLVCVILSALSDTSGAAFTASTEDVKCFSYDTACNICVQEPDCKWCAESKNTYTDGHHCFSVNSDLSEICTTVENPQNEETKFETGSPSDSDRSRGGDESLIQLSPQRVHLKLRKGKPYNITLSYRHVDDYPLDLYYLMDLSKSMHQDKLTLERLGTHLAQTMRNLTKQFKIGFGSFVDKVMLPFVNIHPKELKRPCNDIDCATPFSFRNNLKLIEDEKEFVAMVKAAQISSNLDSPEGGFDALMQAMVCEEEIGWRKNVRKIIIFSTDAAFHSAGDGKLAGVLTPNDGQCHLNHEGIYDKYDEFDYPSIGQINAVAQEKGINIIFAVKDHVNLYKKLSERIRDSSYGELDQDSKNVVGLVTNVYNSIADTVEIGLRSSYHERPTSVRFFSDCGLKHSGVQETNVCNGVKEGANFDITVELTLTNCLENGRNISSIEIGTLQDSVLVDVEPLCACECEKKGYEENSDACSGHGRRQCEVCLCDAGYYGEKCQCHKDTISKQTDRNLNDTSKCRLQGSPLTDPVCSGRGHCECGLCICWKERHSGRFCQCDKGMCRQHVNSNTECSGNGRCDCNKCLCNPGWEGQFCECRSEDSCFQNRNGDICSGHGDCVCGKCECQAPYTGKYCEDCPSCDGGKCLEFRPCVQCKVWQSGELEGVACNNCTYDTIPTVKSLDLHLQQWAVLCTFEDESRGCDFNFTYKYTDGGGYEIYAQNKQKCPPKVDILAVTFGVILGIVAIGVLTLIIWKILTTIHDRREFMRFENERKNAAWNTEGNPLYESATTTVSNPAFSTK